MTVLIPMESMRDEVQYTPDNGRVRLSFRGKSNFSKPFLNQILGVKR